MSIRKPLVVILGSTGSGKTKLSLDLAKAFNGEIIGADSMQIYKKLDILSAKPTPEERKVAPHHLIDVLHPHETCTVVDYRNSAISIIEKLFKNNKLPIIVGGTNYYIESILWKILVEESGEVLKHKPWEFRLKNPSVPSEKLHEKLKQIDPNMAMRLHPNNKRKIIRYLEICERKGRKASEILKDQQLDEGGSALGGGLRYKNTIIFWLQWDQSILDKRVNDRVDMMVKEGLQEELKDYYNHFSDRSDDYNQGINQMIGPKEFHDYMMLKPEEQLDEIGRKMFKESVEKLKQVTRRYSRKQIKWIKNRFLGRNDREVPPVYDLKIDDVDQWDNQVLKPAIKVVQCFVNDEKCELKPLEKIQIKSTPNSLDETFTCETCQRLFVGQFQWNDHLKSRRHKKMLAKVAKSVKSNVTCNPE